MKRDSILVADSGSSKTDWGIVGSSALIKTLGINPFHQDDDAILSILRNELLPQLPVADNPSSVNAVHFYGSGVLTEQESRMERLLREVFPQADTIEAKSDMLGAARALCGNIEGLACILGTGANSCLYDGNCIVANTPALGYILGDEGSGAVLGRMFLNALYKGRLYAEARQEFEQHFSMTMTDVITRVYRMPMANRWLASLSVFIHDHLQYPAVYDIVVANFRDFIRHNVNAYQRRDLPLSAVGSIAFFYREQLEQAAKEEGYALGKILRSPIDGLLSLAY